VVHLHLIVSKFGGGASTVAENLQATLELITDSQIVVSALGGWKAWGIPGKFDYVNVSKRLENNISIAPSAEHFILHGPAVVSCLEELKNDYPNHTIYFTERVLDNDYEERKSKYYNRHNKNLGQEIWNEFNTEIETNYANLVSTYNPEFIVFKDFKFDLDENLFVEPTLNTSLSYLIKVGLINSSN